LGLFQTAYGCSGWREWFKPRRRDFRFTCPGCGMRHAIDFKVEKDGKGFSLWMRIKQSRKKREPQPPS
jgi:hypothetical protein